MDDATNQPPKDPPIFQLGLALAGAISAGAYTAGVLDFLVQALSDWEKQCADLEKERDEPEVIKHRVVIKVMAGASAGAITGALGTIALARGAAPREFTAQEVENVYPDPLPTRQTQQCVLPALYETWVTLPAMIGTNGRRGLLSLDDIKANSSEPVVRSVLNSNLLDDIRNIAIEPPNRCSVQAVPFVSEPLHIYMTVSNMRGIPFKVDFGRNTYGMQTIGDRVHYVVNDLGGRPGHPANAWLAADSGTEISVTALARESITDLKPWHMYGTCALASGAFPVGLASRELQMPWDFYTKRSYPIPMPPGLSIQPNFPREIEGEFVFQSVDGGLVNNSPFDYAQYALTGGPATGPVDGNVVDRAIVMVAPFPEPPALLPEGVPSSAVTSILKNLFPSLINQARFRTADLAPAFNDRDFSRYLIAPTRRKPKEHETDGERPLERYAIACGLLSGFGGFLDEKFRAHDFQLGRRNCQQFLKTSFLVPESNSVIRGISHDGLKPIIQLVGSAAAPVPLPVWPQMSQDDYDELCRHIDARILAIAPALIDSQTSNARLQRFLKFGWRMFLKSRACNFVHGTILVDMVRRGQIEGWKIPPATENVAAQYQRRLDDVNAIIAELVNPSYDFRTAESIKRATHLPADFVEAVLQSLMTSSNPKTKVWREGDKYALSECSNFLGRFSFFRAVRKWWRPDVVG